MSKRKITRDDIVTQSSDDVTAQMQRGQHLYTSHDHSPSNTWNVDETCVTWAIGPLHMYVPQNQQRASNVGIPNIKLRITAVITVNGLGDFAPLITALIISCYSLYMCDLRLDGRSDQLLLK